MLSPQHFSLVLLILISTAQAHSCTPLYSLAASGQRRYISYQQRGLPREFIEPYSKAFFAHLLHFARSNFPTTNFYDVCLSSSEVAQFSRQYQDRDAVEEQIDILRDRYPSLGYIPRSERKDIPRDERFKTASRNYLAKTFDSVEKEMFDQAGVLPATIKVLYDPDLEENLRIYNVHASYAPHMSALQFLREVTGIVLTLELIEVPRASSIQLLRHAVAWLSTVFRALQRDGTNVQIAVLFMPFYRHVYQQLFKESKYRYKHLVRMVDERTVRLEVGRMLEVYCRVEAWGRLEVIRWDQQWEIWTIESTLFDPALLKRISARNWFENPDIDRQVSYERLHRLERTTEWRNLTANTSGKWEWEMCEEPLYEFVPRAETTWKEKCCAVICCNASIMLMAGISREVCCGFCNQLDCIMEGSPLTQLAVVVLQPYGCNGGGYVTVSL